MKSRVKGKSTERKLNGKEGEAKRKEELTNSWCHMETGNCQLWLHSCGFEISEGMTWGSAFWIFWGLKMFEV